MTTTEDTETDAELLARYQRVHDMIIERIPKRDKLPPGWRRDSASRFLGSLNFTKGQIESKIEDRNLQVRRLPSTD